MRDLSITPARFKTANSLHSAEDVVVAEFDLLGTNSGKFYGLEPTNRSFRVPDVALFFFVDDKIINERIYFDSIGLLSQIGQEKVLE